MLMLGVFFLLMAGVTFYAVGMHEKKAAELKAQRPVLTSPEDIAKNEKDLKNRLGAAKSAKFSTVMLVVFAIFNFVYPFVV